MGIVYLIQPSILKGLSRYKIGCSKSSFITRLQNGYRSGTRILSVCGTNNPHELENIIKKEFDKSFHNYSGREFYEGNPNEMFKLFTEIVLKYNNDTQPFTENIKTEIKEEEIKEEEIEILKEEDICDEEKVCSDKDENTELFIPSLKKFELNPINDRYEKRVIHKNKLYVVSVNQNTYTRNISKSINRWLKVTGSMESTFPYGHITNVRVSSLYDITNNGCEFCGRKCLSLQIKRRHMKICKHRNTNIY